MIFFDDSEVNSESQSKKCHFPCGMKAMVQNSSDKNKASIIKDLKYYREIILTTSKK